MSESESVLPGKGKNDYEKYLKVPQLLDCQKAPEELAHRDELMFQIVHQNAELWMKLQIFELQETRARMEREACLGAMTVMSLKGRAIDFLSENLEQRFYPELWEVRNRLTRRAGTSY